MKVVILHDWLTGFRGGERVLETICEMYPNAPIYTLIHEKGSTSPTIESREIKTSFLNKIPGIYQSYRKFLPLMPLAAHMLKITHDCDLVISSSHCVIKGIKKPKGSKHICYIHSPMRYIYDQFHNYFGNASLHIRIAANILRPFLKWWDVKSNKNVDQFLPNSEFVKSRITKYYKRDSQVVYPFVDLKDFRKYQQSPLGKKDFYLMVTAFAPNKRVDLAIDAFNKLGLKLKIIGGGSGEEVEGLKSRANSNIQFLGKVSRETILKEMNMAQAFIFPGVEDFGITPLEALASGTPVIAYKAGGVLETLNDNVASFFTEPSVESLIKSIKQYDLNNFNRSDLLGRAEEFSKEVFVGKIKEQINGVLK